VVGWTIGYGSVLTALGVGGFVATGAQHKTALIPAGFGLASVGLGLLLARGKGSPRGTLGAAAALGAIAVAGSARGLRKLPALVRGEDVERPAAVIAQSIMAVASIAHVGLCVRALAKR
jgi:hypothetical protein